MECARDQKEGIMVALRMARGMSWMAAWEKTRDEAAEAKAEAVARSMALNDMPDEPIGDIERA